MPSDPRPMTARRTLLTAVAVVVLLAGALVVWRIAGRGGDTDQAEPKPTVDSTMPDVGTTGTTAPATTTTFMASLPIPEPPPPTVRDPLTWPFAWNSIWNVPLGSDARRVPAGLSIAEAGVSADEDILILEPTAPLTDILTHDAGWNAQLQRCDEATGAPLITSVPIPDGFVTDPGFLGATPNHAAAILLPDGDTVVQTQPLHRCSATGPAVSQYEFARDSLRNGDGIAGAHGGSRMSSIGGTLRLGELVPGGAIRHALKINIDCEAFCAYDRAEAEGTPGYRWPALAADFEAPTRYAGPVPELQMGALLALPQGFDAESLRTEPARMVARALLRYGAYVVDDTRYPVFAITTEWSPRGRVIDEFEQAWGFPLHDAAKASCTDDSAACAWVQDMGEIIAALEVIDNNGPDAIGGGGAPLAPCAPAYADGTGAAACPTT
ncbi:MAG: hypothetical protein AB7W59_31435 [Acidimicrobiia bacterium]